MKSYTGYTPNGVEVSCKIDPEKSEAIVEYEEYGGISHDPTHFCEYQYNTKNPRKDTSSMNPQSFDQFTSRIAGEVIVPGSQAYDHVRTIFNQGGKMMISKLCILLGVASGIIMLLAACSTVAPSDIATSNTVHMNGSNFVQSSITSQVRRRSRMSRSTGTVRKILAPSPQPAHSSSIVRSMRA